MNFNSAAHPLSIQQQQSKIMEWTNDDALELIEQYRGHTELWNRADPKYKDKLCRFRAWSEIAERFGCSKAEVERKMNVLLTQYRREKHKMLVKLYQGIQPNPSKWYAFKRFDFMEAGGGSGGGVATGAVIGNGGAGNNATSGLTSGTNGHSTATAAAAAMLNGLSAYETNTSAVAAATAGAVPNISSHHRRMKSKEMKYFGAMGLNLPMLIANSQTLDSWNTVGQFSPPISSAGSGGGGPGERGQLRVPLPMPFSASQSELSVPSGGRSLFAGSSNSDMTASPQKPMETADIDDKDDTKHERTTPTSSTHDGASASGGGPGSSGGGGGGRGGAGSSGGEHESGSSPLASANMHEAHKNRHASHDQDALDIKQELVDYFHAPHPPAPPDSHRSYSSTEENRLGGGGAGGAGTDSDDFAQDLRVSAAAAAAAKGLDFSHFVLPRNLRRSSESLDEKFTPLNMRKLSAATAATAATAGQMLMNSLLSNESMSDGDTTTNTVRIKSAASQEAASNSAAAAAAAIYAESLNRDDCDFIGSNVTLKLRSMDRTQRIIAEKLISEVLFYGQFNELERSARIQPK